jgi:preprotein translocase subunit Sec63
MKNIPKIEHLKTLNIRELNREQLEQLVCLYQLINSEENEETQKTIENIYSKITDNLNRKKYTSKTTTNGFTVYSYETKHTIYLNNK